MSPVQLINWRKHWLVLGTSRLTVVRNVADQSQTVSGSLGRRMKALVRNCHGNYVFGYRTHLDKKTNFEGIARYLKLFPTDNATKYLYLRGTVCYDKLHTCSPMMFLPSFSFSGRNFRCCFSAYFTPTFTLLPFVFACVVTIRNPFRCFSPVFARMRQVCFAEGLRTTGSFPQPQT